MHTEEQAAKLWCPMAGGAAEWRCMGSACSMWRWLPLAADEAFIEAVKKAATDISDTTPSRSKASKHVIKNRATYGLPTDPFKGFCGLAGRPL